jgi:hypothetical protein
MPRKAATPVIKVKKSLPHIKNRPIFDYRALPNAGMILVEEMELNSS